MSGRCPMAFMLKRCHRCWPKRDRCGIEPTAEANKYGAGIRAAPCRPVLLRIRSERVHCFVSRGSIVD